VKQLLSTAAVPTAAVALNATTAQFAQNYAAETDYGYDLLNRLNEVDLKGNYSNGGSAFPFEEQLTYSYDNQNRRVAQLDNHNSGTDSWPGTASNLWHRETYDGTGPVRDASAAYDSGNLANVADFIRGSDWGGGVGGILYSIAGGGNGTNTAQYYHYDGRGDVVALTSNTGSVSYQAAYDAYGTHGNVSAKGTEESGTDGDLFRLTTKEEDPTGLSYQLNRHLDLTTNTWLTRDPLGQAAGPNPYTYVEQNPWTKFDPEGLEAGDGTPPNSDHHISPQQTWRDNKFSDDVKKQLDTHTIGGVDHGWSKAHDTYNQKAGEITKDYIQKWEKSGKGNPSGLSGKEAKEFADGLVKDLSNDKYIKGFCGLVEKGANTSELNAYVDVARASGLVNDGKAVLKGAALEDKLGILGEHLPGVLKALAIVPAAMEFKQDWQEKGASEAVNTQFFRFFTITGMTPEEEKKAPESFQNWLFTGNYETNGEQSAREQAQK
jgi:RHS repeat-associated protein